MKRKLLFLFAVFVATVLLMASLKPFFLVSYVFGHGFGLRDWVLVFLHGLSLDLAVRGC